MSDTRSTGRKQAPGFFRYGLGDFEVLALHDGVASFDRPAGLVTNASDEAVGEAFATAGMARDKATLTFNPMLVDTGTQLVLIDTGWGETGPGSAGKLAQNLAAAGIAPEAIGAVIVSHFHSDHIMGLLKADGTAAFPAAEVLVPQPEWAFWTDEGRAASAPEAMKGQFEGVRKVFGGLSPRRYGWNEEVLPGIRAVQADGHTPGMAALEVTSGDDAVLFVADITNNPLIFARHPDWQLMFDMDAARATETRKAILDRAAADKLRLHFFHAPFPATGYVAKSDTGYEFLPALWQ